MKLFIMITIISANLYGGSISNILKEATLDTGKEVVKDQAKNKKPVDTVSNVKKRIHTKTYKNENPYYITNRMKKRPE